MSYSMDERIRAANWKRTTETLPDAAKQPAAYVSQSGQASGDAVDYCLPREFACAPSQVEHRDLDDL